MIIDRKNKYKGHFGIDELTYKSKSGQLAKREVFTRHNGVAALVYDTNKEKYILTSQWRAGSTGDMVEIVAGTLDKPDESPREAIVREIQEEIGYTTDTIKLLDECYMSPGCSTELLSIYFCEVSQKVSEGGGLKSENEEIEIIEMTADELFTTPFKDAKTIIAVNWAKHNYKK
jgi:ADP-ribose pyrophosphatase